MDIFGEGMVFGIWGVVFDDFWVVGGGIFSGEFVFVWCYDGS